jgi:hypothetical protein
MSYGLSVFWLPLSKALGATAGDSCKAMNVIDAAFTT